MSGDIDDDAKTVSAACSNHWLPVGKRSLDVISNSPSTDWDTAECALATTDSSINRFLLAFGVARQPRFVHVVEDEGVSDYIVTKLVTSTYFEYTGNPSSFDGLPVLGA